MSDMDFGEESKLNDINQNDSGLEARHKFGPVDSHAKVSNEGKMPQLDGISAALGPFNTGFDVI